MTNAPALVVHTSAGQRALNLARNMDLIDKSLRVLTIDNELCIPLIQSIDRSEETRLSLELGSFTIEKREFSERASRHRTLVDALEETLPPQLLALLPRSYDLIGSIAIIEIPDELAPLDAVVGKAVMEVSANVRTVMAKAGSFSTEYRVRELRLIAGEDNSVTRHKEHGCSYELDVRTVFFSPRLGHERLRVASQVQSNEVVVDMFAGVGCYSILTAKRQPACIVHAIDVNPEAYKFLVSNVLSNRVLANVKATMGDARAIIRAKLSGIADRVIMNLPGQAADFLGDACLALKERGGIIHFYSFDSADAPLDETSEKLKGRIRASGRRVKSILAARVVKAVAPYRVQTAIDALIV